MKFAVSVDVDDIVQSSSTWRMWIEIYRWHRIWDAWTGHPPHGGCGLKWSAGCALLPLPPGHPPHGGCGLKWNQLDEIALCCTCHPPHGGCGLKLGEAQHNAQEDPSSSTWRMWIEILVVMVAYRLDVVILHMEDVD